MNTPIFNEIAKEAMVENVLKIAGGVVVLLIFGSFIFLNNATECSGPLGAIDHLLPLVRLFC